nr:chloride channel protein [Secundilactobacillus collinoides]
MEKKFVGGVLAIGSGLFLGREGPSIQLGATVGQGVAAVTHNTGSQRRLMIASGASAGLSAAFNAPIASTLFILEEVYHNFSTLIWLSALASALAATSCRRPFLASHRFYILVTLPRYRSDNMAC